ncbi:MAG: penicillin-binding transpeptidase domain-containing protein, partial [Prolixibacteraceae bacterium]|nr:penicillin-binding transpeptidase domain-containing protein [Prolixibacteraceae bacterium]
PLQILTFYNAVANDGSMVKPRFVKEIRDNGVLVRQVKTEVLNPMIVSKETLGKAKKMLEGVCEYGTGRSLRNEWFRIAGKTGTAQIAVGVGGYQKGMYLASFVGYFPADDPQYSLIVTVNNPRGGLYYGGSVAGPVFSEIAERVYASRQLHENEQEQDDDEEKYSLPEIKKGNVENIYRVANELGIKDLSGLPLLSDSKVKKADRQNIPADNSVMGKVPDVRGMGPSEAVFMLEKAGLRVRLQGTGKVKTQSQEPGSKLVRGSYIYVKLG